MGFRTGAYAKLWEIEQKSQGRSRVRLSTSRKDKETGEYETDFSGFVDFCGSACVQKLSRHKNGDRVVLGDVDVTVRYDKEKDVQYTNFKCFSFEEIEDGGAPRHTRPAAKHVDDGEIDNDIDEDDGSYPF